ncbi:hypothetical protein L0222_15205 [bacterium]|nr:hypothetical protein [bacterium]MCI0604238.1 hypothetical protein [bacterium]
MSKQSSADVWSAFLIILFIALIGCQKQPPTAPDVTPATPETSQEPVQKLARDASEKIQLTLKNDAASTIEILGLDSHEIFPAPAFTFFTNALTTQLASLGIQKTPGVWKLKGDLSKQRGQVVFSFEIFKNGERISTDSVSVPDDERLQNTLAQFETPEKPHDHTVHKEMPVPTPLAELKEIPLDVAENCQGTENCSVLLLYSNALVERSWQNGTERTINLPITAAQRSRAPSGKILKIQEAFFIVSNQLATPAVFQRNLTQTSGQLPGHLPKPEPGLNTYALSEGRFYDFAEFGPNGLAVIDVTNRLHVADQGKLTSATEPVGGTICVAPPYIYTSSPSLPEKGQDSIQKFIYKDGLVRLEKSQNIEGSIYDIVITDLNQDRQNEMLVTVRNERGIFIEVQDPF